MPPPHKHKVLDQVWEELRKLDWHAVNRQCEQPIRVGILGGPDEQKAMIEWLFSLESSLVNNGGVSIDAAAKIRTIEHSVVAADPDAHAQIRALDGTDVVIAAADEKPAVKDGYFRFATDANLEDRILASIPESGAALAHRFPRFRPAMANGTIHRVALQNASWAVFTAAPDLIPGPHQVVTAPVEAISDFVVMTANEMKMLFELTGQAGHRVNPLGCIAEVGIVLGLAEIAKQVASQAVAKLPAGGGLSAKAAIAYAATYAMGEAIFVYQTVGERVGLDFIAERFQACRHKAEAIVADLVVSRAKPPTN